MVPRLGDRAVIAVGEAQPRTCTDRSEHGIFLRGAPSRTITLGMADLATLLAQEDLGEGLRELLVAKGVALPWTRECPLASAILQPEDYAPDSDRCGACGSPTRAIEREEFRP